MGQQETSVLGILLLSLSCLILIASFSPVLAQEEERTYETVVHAGYNFSVSDIQLPWAQAVEACEAIGQKLTSVETPEKDDILVVLFSEHKHTNVTLKGNSWVSATETREGVWQWASLDKPIYHSRWFMDGQPDDKENLNCVYLAATAMLYWRDANCSASMYYICESELSEGTEGPPPNNSAFSSLQITPVFSLFGILVVKLLPYL